MIDVSKYYFFSISIINQIFLENQFFVKSLYCEKLPCLSFLSKEDLSKGTLTNHWMNYEIIYWNLVTVLKWKITNRTQQWTFWLSRWIKLVDNFLWFLFDNCLCWCAIHFMMWWNNFRIILRFKFLKKCRSVFILGIFYQNPHFRLITS